LLQNFTKYYLKKSLKFYSDNSLRKWLHG
jgi:hypothetical protein